MSSRCPSGPVLRIRALVALVPIALLGCTSSTEPPTSGETPLTRPSPSVPSLVSTPSGAASEASGSAGATEGRPFGPGCSRILGGDAGTVARLSAAQLADALAESPALTRLRQAVEGAGLGDVLDSADGVTLLAPDDEAFSRLSRPDAGRLLADHSRLVRVVQTHVVPERLGPDRLVGRHPTLSGATIDVTGSGQDLTVDGDAHVVCGDIQTANATIYVIDRVLTTG